MRVNVARLSISEFDYALSALITLLGDAVNSGASLGYLTETPISEYENFWRMEFRKVEEGQNVILVARTETELIGVVCLNNVGKANQRHRAEVKKLLVALDHQKQGIATRLMSEVEAIAKAEGKSLLNLDTESNSAAEFLYQKLG